MGRSRQPRWGPGQPRHARPGPVLKCRGTGRQAGRVVAAGTAGLGVGGLPKAASGSFSGSGDTSALSSPGLGGFWESPGARCPLAAPRAALPCQASLSGLGAQSRLYGPWASAPSAPRLGPRSCPRLRETWPLQASDAPSPTRPLDPAPPFCGAPAPRCAGQGDALLKLVPQRGCFGYSPQSHLRRCGHGASAWRRGLPMATCVGAELGVTPRPAEPGPGLHAPPRPPLPRPPLRPGLRPAPRQPGTGAVASWPCAPAVHGHRGCRSAWAWPEPDASPGLQTWPATRPRPATSHTQPGRQEAARSRTGFVEFWRAVVAGTVWTWSKEHN